VDTTLMCVDSSARTNMAIVVSSGRTKRMMTFAGADRGLAISAVSEKDLRDVDHVHVVGEPTPSLTRLVDLAHRAGRSVSVEWNGRDMSPLAQGASLSFMNADEAARLPEAVGNDVPATARRHAELISGAVILTMGSHGAVWASPHGELFHEPTVPVEPVDRTGGGDAFNAGVIAGWLSGDSPVACLRKGLDAALHVITKIGAHP
jgi:ribokinase